MREGSAYSETARSPVVAEAKLGGGRGGEQEIRLNRQHGAKSGRAANCKISD